MNTSMWVRRIKRNVSLVALLMLIAVLVPAAMRGGVAHATATGTVSVSPSTVVPGGTIYLTASGSGFQAFQQVSVYISPTVTGLGPYALWTTDASGNLSIPSYPILIPGNATYGTYSVNVNVVSSSSSYSAYVYTTFVVGTSTGTAIAISPTSVVPGQPFTVSGSGWTGSGLKVTISFPTLTSIGTSIVTETQSGTFTSPYIYVPVSTSAGTYTVQATENYVPSGGVAKSATGVITVSGTTGTSSVTLNPLGTTTTVTAVPGGTISVTGLGFLGLGYVTLICSSLGISSSVTDNGGTFYTTLTVPTTAAIGTYVLTATEVGGTRVAYATIQVSSTTSTSGTTLTTTPTTALPGASVVLSGYGYTAGAAVTISGLGSTFTTYALSSGYISTSISVPSTEPYASYLITAQDVYGHVATAYLTVGTADTVSVSPTSGVAGTSVTVTGTGFTSGELVTFGLATGTTTSTYISGTTVSFTASGGTISGTYTVPSTQAAGTYELLAYGNSSGSVAYATFTVTGVAATATNTVPPTATPFPTSTPGFVPFPTRIAVPTQATGPLATISTAATTTYFADGYTGTAATNGKATFTEKLYLFNPGSVSSNVTTTYYVSSTNNTHTTVVKQDTVAAGATTVRDVNGDVGTDKNVSIVVQASAALSPEVVISRVTPSGATLDTASDQGTTALGQTWYLAEGYTGASLQEYLTIFNPGNADAHTQVQYLPSDTAAPAAKAYTVPANSQLTVNVRSDYNALVKHGSRNIGISISSDQPVSVDRSMYWGDGSGSGKYGSSIGSGISAGQSTQYFSYLPAANGSQSFVTVLNPNGSAATTTLTLRDAFGALLLAAPATIGSGQRHTFAIPTPGGGEHRHPVRHAGVQPAGSGRGQRLLRRLAERGQPPRRGHARHGRRLHGHRGGRLRGRRAAPRHQRLRRGYPRTGAQPGSRLAVDAL